MQIRYNKLKFISKNLTMYSIDIYEVEKMKKKKKKSLENHIGMFH